MIRILVLFLVFAVSSCMTQPTPDYGVPSTSPAELKPQLPFTVDNVQYYGAATVQRSSSSTIKITLPSKTLLVIVSTCARQDEFWQPDNSKVFVYNFVPAMYAENVGACPLSVIAITAQGEWHRAIVDFTNAPKDPLPVDVMCNGRWVEDARGAYLCSVREGKPIRVLAASASVIAKDPNSGCFEPKKIGSKEWEIVVKPGFCVYVMVNDKQEFRLTTYGYSSFLKVYPAKEGN